KSLRAERMADCIFNGTTKRPPLGMAEVTITLEDPDLAEAARFVLDSAQASETPALTESAVAPKADGSAAGAADSTGGNVTTEILSLDPAQAPETPEASGEATSTEAGGKFKKKRKGAEKPVLVSKPGEVVVSRRLYRSGQSEYLINGRT